MLAAAGCGGTEPDAAGVPAPPPIARELPERFGFGQPAAHDEIAALDIDVRPDGTGLPPGRGTAAEGAPIYATQCAACHGFAGEGGIGEPLVGAEPRGLPPFGPAYEQWRGDRRDVRLTIGNYWPYATTLWDYINRAMPVAEPGSLEPNEVYALVAWLLSKNGIIAEDAVMDQKTLPQVVMPARDRFVPDDRRGGGEVR